MIKLLKLIIVVFVFLFSSCGKDFLSIKENSNQRIPKSISDYQAILDQTTPMNINSPLGFAFIGSDENYVMENVWLSLTNLEEKNGYLWAEDVYGGGPGRDWGAGYRAIMLANMALEVENIVPTTEEQEAWNNVKGSALFFRAINHFALAQLFCKPYDSNTASTALGIPLRLDADISVRVKRGTLEETYAQVIRDLEVAASLLPVKPSVVHRPSKAAAYAMLARIYLTMEDYRQALTYADLVLADNNVLLDFNKMNLDDIYLMTPQWEDNPELIFMWIMPDIAVLSPANRQNVDSVLLDLYEDSDLRKRGYFRVHAGRIIFKGSYSVGGFLTGLAVDECYLIKSESLVRLGEDNSALQTLNILRKHRYDQSNYIPLENVYGHDLLKLILLERRKELVFRGIRWQDLRRLNKDPNYAEILTKQIGVNHYVLPPNDPRYVWPIPDNEIELSGIEQNIR